MKELTTEEKWLADIEADYQEQIFLEYMRHTKALANIEAAHNAVLEKYPKENEKTVH